MSVAFVFSDRLLNRSSKNGQLKKATSYVEIDGKKDFTSIISDATQEYLKMVGIKEKGQSFIQKALEALKSLVLSFNPEDKTFSLSVQDRELYVSRSYERCLTQVFTSIGDIAYAVGTPICFIIDEIQYMKKDELIQNNLASGKNLTKI